MRLHVAVLSVVAALVAGCAGAEAGRAPPVYADPALDPITWPALERFENERAFQRYLARVEALADERGYRWARREVLYASAEPVIPCDPTIEDCSEDTLNDLSEAITVTGSRVSNPAITNVQTAGVDEGDIVKQIGDVLVVLQDGRLFSVDTRPDGAPGLRFAARADVYRSDDEDTWYDEMLVFGRRIVVTGYSYDEGATEFSVLTLREDASFAREATFYMSSDDYYDVENYATRLVGDQLIIYSPLYLYDLGRFRRSALPVIRRWRPEGEGGARAKDAPGRPLYDARDIYKPVLRTVQPLVHSISVCSIAEVEDADDLGCRTTAIVGPEAYTFYVSPTDAWLWMTSGWDEAEDDNGPWGSTRCKEPDAVGFAASAPSALLRIPLNGRAPSVLGARGTPWDQFGMDADESEVRALLLQWPYNPCNDDVGEQELRYFSAPLRSFDDVLEEAPDRFYAPLPSPGGRRLENRFTGAHLVYAGRETYWSWPPDGDDPPRASRVVAAPLDAPQDAAVLDAGHDVMRLERAGEHAVLTGYRDAKGLSVSVLDLRGAPRIADTVVLIGRYESEGRSHAFNSLIGEDGAGVLGVPTVSAEGDAGRWWWRSERSDVSFLTVDPEVRLSAAGELRANPKGGDPSYECEVSCVDWYGNSRPIFTDGRIFALSGAEVIEGTLVDGRIAEVRRVDLSAPPPGGKAALTH